MCSATWERATKVLSSSPLCKELLFVAYEYYGTTALLYKCSTSCDLRRGRFDTRLFTSNPCNGTSQVKGAQLLAGSVRQWVSKTGRFGHSKHFGSCLIDSQQKPAPPAAPCIIWQSKVVKLVQMVSIVLFSLFEDT